MQEQTRKLWTLQDRHPGDRFRLFRALHDVLPARAVLYPGSFVDIAPSFVFPRVVYADVDRRAAAFFQDEAGIREIVASQPGAPAGPEFSFIHADYTDGLGLADGAFDLLISLYAGFVSEYCMRYLRIGGTLLANPSHGDVAMASIDPRYRLVGVVQSGGGGYRVRTEALEGYLIPKRPTEITRESLHQSGRGVAYTKPAFAYLFERVA